MELEELFKKTKWYVIGVAVLLLFVGFGLCIGSGETKTADGKITPENKSQKNAGLALMGVSVVILLVYILMAIL